MTWLSRRDLGKLAVAGAGTLALGGAGMCGLRARPDVKLAAKDFPEQWILAELLSRRAAEVTGERAGRMNLAGTMLCHEALVSGEVLTYVEYTGTGLTVVLDEPPIADPAEVYRVVRREYEARFGLLWLGLFGFENTYAVLVRRADAERHGLRTIGDLREVQADVGMAMQFEFHDRADGYRGLVDAYELSLGRPPQQMSLGNVYRAVAAGEVDIGVGNSTDGLIAHLDLVMLEDDRRYFPPYQAAPIVRVDTARRHPELVAALDAYAGAITTDAMRAANYQVDHEKRHPHPVATELERRLAAGASLP